MFYKFCVVLASAFVSLGFHSSAVFGQDAGAVLTVRVIDAQRAAIPAARVAARHAATGLAFSGVSDERGVCRLPELAAGTYRLTVANAGFAVWQEEITLAAGAAREVEAALAVAEVAATVMVTSAHLPGGSETQQNVPGAVSVLDKRTLEDSRVFTFSEALRKLPGVNVRDEEGFGLRPNIGLRGLNPTRAAKVLLLEDGLPLSYAPYGDNASYYHPPVERFESIEVVKGSGQILYGPQTVGGVINYLTPAPPDTAQGTLTLTGGNRDYFNGHAAYGGTWRGAGLLFDYTRKQGEGARDNTRSGLNDVNFKAVRAFGERQAVTVKANYYGERSQVTYSGLREAEFRANPRGNPFLNDRFYGNRYGLAGTYALVFSQRLTMTANGYWTHFRRDWWRQSSNSNQRPNDAGDPACGGIANLYTTCGNEGRLRSYFTRGVESRFQSNFRTGRVFHQADFGGRVHFETQDRRQLNGPLPTSRDGVAAELNERRNSAYSVYLQDRFSYGRWTLTPGLRVEKIKFARRNRLANNGAGVIGYAQLAQVIPGLGLSFQPTPTTTIFAGAHRGFAPPRTEDIVTNAGGSVDLDPELSWNYEIGVRSAPRAGVQFEATLFRMDYANQIIPASLAGGAGATLTNGGATRHQGFETSARADFGTLVKSPHNFYLRAAYTYLPEAAFVGARFSAINGFARVSVSGNRLPYAPEHLLTAALGYSHPRGVDALVEANYVSRQFADDLNTVAPTPDGQRGLIPSSVVWNATLNYRVEKLRSTFFVTAKNAFDRLYLADRSRGLLPGPPRAVQAGVKLNF
jgi:Fe(3+) dicitrate transport protein